jgi:hypothetical protein
MRIPFCLASLLEPLEERVDLLPDLRPAAESLPVHSNQADELVAAVDWDDPVLARASRPIDEECFDV